MQRPENQVAELAETISGTLRVARALVLAGRQVDLVGLEADVGRLCAVCLELPREQGRPAAPLLTAVLADLEALQAAVHAAPP